MSVGSLNSSTVSEVTALLEQAEQFRDYNWSCNSKQKVLCLFVSSIAPRTCFSFNMLIGIQNQGIL